jgi:hypothetical protein
MRVALQCTSSERHSADESDAIARSYVVKTGYSRSVSLLKVIGNYTYHCCNVQQLFIDTSTLFRRVRKNCEKRLLASSCLSARLSNSIGQLGSH